MDMGTNEEVSSTRPSEASEGASTSYAERLGWRPKADRDADVDRQRDEARARTDRIAQRVVDNAPYVGDNSFAARAKTVSVVIPGVHQIPSSLDMEELIFLDWDQGTHG